MKTFIGMLALVVTVQGTFLGNLFSQQSSGRQGPPPPPPARHGPPPQIIKVIQQSRSIPHATVPTSSIKIIKVIQEPSAPLHGDTKIIKIIQSGGRPGPVSVAPSGIVKILTQPSIGAVASSHTKVLKVIHDYAPSYQTSVGGGQNIKIVKIINQQAVNGPSVVGGPGASLIKVLTQPGGSGGSGWTSSGGYAYAGGYTQSLSKPGW